MKRPPTLSKKLMLFLGWYPWRSLRDELRQLLRQVGKIASTSAIKSPLGWLIGKVLSGKLKTLKENLWIVRKQTTGFFFWKWLDVLSWFEGPRDDVPPEDGINITQEPVLDWMIFGLIRMFCSQWNTSVNMQLEPYRARWIGVLLKAQSEGWRP